jgi:hypothetical protein
VRLAAGEVGGTWQGGGMKILTLALLVGLAACGGKSHPPSTSNESGAGADDTDTTPPAPSVVEGGHFAAERVYEGQCAPAGSRGGCHTITFRPDGTFDNLLFDAVISGTYTIEDHIVVLTDGGGGSNQMTLSDDYGKLDDLDLKS